MIFGWVNNQSFESILETLYFMILIVSPEKDVVELNVTIVGCILTSSLHEVDEFVLGANVHGCWFLIWYYLSNMRQINLMK